MYLTQTECLYVLSSSVVIRNNDDDDDDDNNNTKYTMTSPQQLIETSKTAQI
jgi:hypothetical protein